MNKIYISWRNYGLMINSLIEKVKRDGLQFDGVYGVPRGGLVIALAFSHSLNLPILLYSTNESLVVDDISDTGITLQNIKHKRIATLYTTKWAITTPNYWVREKLNKQDWLVYPYEKQNKQENDKNK